MGYNILKALWKSAEIAQDVIKNLCKELFLKMKTNGVIAAC